MSESANKELVRRFYEDVCNNHRLELMDELFVPNYEHHDSQLPPDVLHGSDNYRRGIQVFFDAFPDLRCEIVTQLAEGNMVGTWLRWRGTQTGELQGIPPTGRSVDFQMAETHRVEGGKLAEGWTNWDAMAMLQQLGVIPTPETVQA